MAKKKNKKHNKHNKHNKNNYGQTNSINPASEEKPIEILSQSEAVAVKKSPSIKSVVAIVVACVLLIGALTVGLVSIINRKEASDGLLYSKVEGGYVIVGIGECTDEELVIPTLFKGEYVVEIADKAFSNCESIKSVVFAKNSRIKRIGVGAFQNCTSLNSVVIDESVEFIGEEAFFGCASLEKVSFEDEDGWGYYYGARCEVSSDFFENDKLISWLINIEDADGEECGLTLTKSN